MAGIVLRILYKLAHEPHEYRVAPRRCALPPGVTFLPTGYWSKYSKWANGNAFLGNLDLSTLFLLYFARLMNRTDKTRGWLWP